MPAGDLESPEVPCPSCGHLNDPGRLICDSCGADLPKTFETPAPPPAPQERPGCVTAYAILLAFGGAIRFFFALTFDSAWTLLGATLDILAAYGLWNRKNWGRILAMVLGVLGIFYYTLLDVYTRYGVIGFLISLIINGIIIWWFAFHREYFN